MVYTFWYVTWIISVSTSKHPTMVTHITSTPAVIHHHSVFNRTENKVWEIHFNPLTYITVMCLVSPRVGSLQYMFYVKWPWGQSWSS